MTHSANEQDALEQTKVVTEPASAPAEDAAGHAVSGPTGIRALIKRVGGTGLLGLAWGTLPAIAGIYLLAELGPVSAWLRGQESLGVAVYVTAFIVLAGFGLLPTYAQAVLGGWVFGVLIGIPAALAGFTGAAVIGYLITRFVSRDRIEEMIAEHKRAEVIRNALIGRGFARTLGIVTLLRVPPTSPFALTNLAMAASGVGLPVFTLGTLLGMAPRTIVTVAFAAAGAATGAADIQTFVTEGPGTWWFLAGVASMIAVLALIGHISNRAIQRVIETPESDNR